MTYNIYLNDFDKCDYKSKNSKNLIKKYIKSNITDLNDLQNNFNKIKNYIINNYFDNINFDINYSINDNDLYLNKLEKISIVDKLKYKLLENNINLNDIECTYILLKQKLKNVPSPLEVKNNKNKYIDIIFQHLLFLIKNNNDINIVHNKMNNDFINYLQNICEFNYKDYFNDFLYKIKDLANENEEIPKIIKNLPYNKLENDKLDPNILNELNDIKDNITINE